MPDVRPLTADRLFALDSVRLASFRTTHIDQALVMPHAFGDVSHDPQNEARLHAAADSRRLLEIFHHPALLLSPNEIVIDVNDEACRVYGFSREQFVGLDMKTISVDVPAGERQLERVLRGESVHFESRQLRRDGTPFQLDIRASAIPYGDGVAVLTVNRDVTEERERDAALRESEERYRSLFENAPIGICRVSFDGRILGVNEALLRLLGYSDRVQLAGTPLQTLVVDERDRRQIIQELRQTGFTRHELQVVRADSQIIRVEVQARVADDVVEAFVSDVTARHAAIEESARLATELQVLLQSAYEGIAATDADGRCTAANGAAARMFRLDAADIAGRHVHDLIHHGCADAQCWIRNPVTGHDPVRIEDVLWRGDGAQFRAEIVASPVMVDGRRLGTVWSFLDVSERIATSKRLEVAERAAGLGRLASSMAHEFNNVLMAILPVADVLERKVVDERLLRLVAGMKTSVLRGKKITQEVLRYSHQHEPVVESMAVAAFLSELREELASVVGANVAVRVHLPDESLHLTADRQQLRETFLRVAENARDAMPRGGILTITAVRDENRPSHVDFAIADDGIGMSRDVLERALEPMFTTNRAATGLGLALADRVIKDHGGEIFIESTPGQGTTVHLLLPLDRTVPPGSGAESQVRESRNEG